MHICSFLWQFMRKNNEVYTALGLTIEECRVIIADTIAKARIIWEDEEIEEEDEPDTLFPEDSPSGILNTLIRWGWLKSDFDAKVKYVYYFFPGIQPAVYGIVSEASDRR